MSAEAPQTSVYESKTAENEPGLLEKGKHKQALKKDAMSSPTSAPTLLPSPPLTMSPGERRMSPLGSPQMYPAGIAASPGRRGHRSSSPGLHSPASSQIFERNVQEPAEPSPAIPSHIQTEDKIPAALDASSIAITDKQLNPDEVEIIMHAAHQPAAAVVAGSVGELHSQSYEDFVGSHGDLADSMSSNPNYGSVDTTDPRRLSFISFADVVQAEHAETDRDAVQFMSLSSTVDRSPSPVRSPASSRGFSASPPRSGAPSERGILGIGAGTRSPGSPATHGTQSPPLGGGELQIETMRQALRRTGSGDLSGARSQPLSALSLDDSPAAEQPSFN